MEQKDMMIYELKDKIGILNKHIDLLEKLHEIESHKIRNKNKNLHVKKQVNITWGAEGIPDLSVPADNVMADNGDINEPNVSDIISVTLNEGTETEEVNDWKHVSYNNGKKKTKDECKHNDNGFLPKTNAISHETRENKENHAQEK